MPSSIDLAVQLGLKPYEEFELVLGPLFRRISTEQRDQILEKIYALAAQKTIDEADRKETPEWAVELRNRRQSVVATRRHLRKAAGQLLAAKGKFHPELPKWFDVDPLVEWLKEFEAVLAENEGVLGRMAAVLKDPTGKTIAHQGAYTIVALEPAFADPDGYIFPGRGHTDLDDPFIAALDDCLPKVADGKRRRFDGDKVIAKVFELLGQRRTKSSITQARTRVEGLAGGN
jgi:hypothetical protein